MLKPESDHKFDAKQLYLLGMVYQLGISVVVPLVVCILGGVWLDKYFDMKPKFTLGGIVIGLYLGACSVYYVLKPIFKSDKGKIREKNVG